MCILLLNVITLPWILFARASCTVVNIIFFLSELLVNQGSVLGPPSSIGSEAP